MAQTYPYDIDLFLMQQQRSLFENMATTGLHLWTEQSLKKPQITELKEIIDDQFAGALKAGKTLITHSGLRSERMGQTARENMIDEVARYAREKLITAYDLSEGKLGLIQDVIEPIWKGWKNLSMLCDPVLIEKYQTFLFYDSS
jgi:hypothetical protein